MRRIVLFSTFLTGKDLDRLLKLIFPNEIKRKRLAYMPSDGAKIKKEYLHQWQQFAKDFDTQFNLVDNSKIKDAEEGEKIVNSNILVITGGNTFTLLRNLRRSGLDKAVKDFVKKKEFVLAGFSAGAVVLTPSIRVCEVKNYDENEVGIKNLKGLGIIDFEVFPHFSEEWRDSLKKYEKDNSVRVKRIADNEVFTFVL